MLLHFVPVADPRPLTESQLPSVLRRYLSLSVMKTSFSVGKASGGI